MNEDKCQNESLGRLLPEYELELLGDNDREQFELHLMACEFCFEKAETMRRPMKLVRNDATLREPAVAEAKAGDIPGSSFQKLIAFLWPQGSLLAKPAISLLLLVLLIPLAYDSLLNDNARRTATPAFLLELTDTRSIDGKRVALDHGIDLVVSFAFLTGTPSGDYEVKVQDAAGEAVYSSDSFRLDNQLSGRLIIPFADLNSGKYTLIVNDPEDDSPFGSDTLSFQVALND